MDEIYAVAKSWDRTGHRSFSIVGIDEHEQTLNTLLTELDEFITPHHHHQNNGRYNDKDDGVKVTIILIIATNLRHTRIHHRQSLELAGNSCKDLKVNPPRHLQLAIRENKQLDTTIKVTIAGEGGGYSAHSQEFN